MSEAAVSVAVVGGGIAGLYAARLLHAAGVDALVLEARDRLGGRILTAEPGMDLGPSWYWPETQPRLDTLVRQLGLSSFPQHDTGDVLVERLPGQAPHRFAGFRQVPQSMRLSGGTAVLVQAIARGLPPNSIRLDARVAKVALTAEGVVLSLTGGSEQLTARHIILAAPPRLIEETMTFTPGIAPDAAQRWRDTPTWMAPTAKFVARYERAFWRSAGLSGMAQSLLGPLGEIHDATTANSEAALLGFLGLDAERRLAAGEARLIQSCLNQLGRLFGAEALRPTATLLKDWSADPLTATADDRRAREHLVPQREPWVDARWSGVLTLAGSETSPSEPGYLAGAVDAAARAVSQTLECLAAAPNKDRPCA